MGESKTKFYAKFLKLVGRFLPVTLSLFDIGRELALLNVAKQKLDAIFGTFAKNLHPSIGQVLHPADKPQIRGQFLGRITKTDALNSSAVKNMRAANLTQLFFLHANSINYLP